MANTTTTKTVTWTRGLNTIHAGQPLDTNGKPVMDNTAVGIVAEDLHAPDKTATVITAGEWDESVNAPYFHITDAVKRKLIGIEFTTAPAIPESAYVLITDLATVDSVGVVKQAAAVADAESSPTQEEFNGLLEALRDAGIIAAPEAPEQTEE